MSLFANSLEKAGLQAYEIDALRRALLAFPEVEKVVLYGSRARGDFFDNSDVDIALSGEKLTDRLLWQFHSCLTEGLPFLRSVDVVDPTRPGTERLALHIERDGVLIYEREG